MIALSPEQRLACQRTFIVSTEIHYNINNCAFPAKLDSYHTSAVDPVLGTQNQFILVKIIDFSLLVPQKLSVESSINNDVHQKSMFKVSRSQQHVVISKEKKEMFLQQHI